MPTLFKIDTEAVEQLADILKKTELSEIEYEDNGKRIRVVKASTSLMTVSPSSPLLPGAQSEDAALAQAGQAAASPTDHREALKSPMVGTAYLTPEPGAPPFVKVGDHVNAGQTLMIIEAMKVMNPIKANKSGKILDIFVKDAHPVEFGEPLLIIG